jgi:hypothetical protein
MGDNSILGMVFERYDPANGQTFKTDKGVEGTGMSRRVETFSSAPDIYSPFYKTVPARPGFYRLAILQVAPSTSMGTTLISGGNYWNTYVDATHRPNVPAQSRVRLAQATDWRTVTFEVRPGEVTYVGDVVMDAPGGTYPTKIVAIRSNPEAARAALASRPDLASRLVVRTMKEIPF